MPYLIALRSRTLHALCKARDFLSNRFLRYQHSKLILRPWRPLRREDVPAGVRAWCVLCDWRGDAFIGMRHSEQGICPRCGSIARDRFLHLCLFERVPYRRDLYLLETSPRLGPEYRAAMGRRVHYLASDYDERAHKASVKLDLQHMPEVPDETLDVILSAHVLEHVPDTDAALKEMYRVLRPDGYLLLQVPLLQAVTAPPTEPEFHGDNTPVFWRFGLDLTARLRKVGFETTLLVTPDFYRRVKERDAYWPPEELSPEWDVIALVHTANPGDLTPISTDAVCRLAWIDPSYQHATWECRKPRLTPKLMVNSSQNFRRVK